MSAKNQYVGPLVLDRELYHQLDRQARTSERDPLQHARWLIRCALTYGAPARTEPRPAQRQGDARI